ncbi:hypothetical protein O53_3797 [Microcystis aeruginosa TAIHU98]|uniref:Uncharacterized protein n=1 Tax=Microcystis aeruginosa TAIHU98 TaxID=1134457 RepID=L7E7G0_MICAE|nr:hypothetical protein O53_3797 [Microcystis aeruginosa TAIHU98]ODV37102.1 hypothetical protein BFG60_3420 [Microcystis aeruginosa NIES-98]
MWGVGCRVLPIFRGSIFPPDHPKVWHFLMGKKSKILIQQGF